MAVRDELLPLEPGTVWRPAVAKVDELTILGHDFHSLLTDPVTLANAA